MFGGSGCFFSRIFLEEKKANAQTIKALAKYSFAAKCLDKFEHSAMSRKKGIANLRPIKWKAVLFLPKKQGGFCVVRHGLGRRKIPDGGIQYRIPVDRQNGY